jgi:hypothetical protein
MNMVLKNCIDPSEEIGVRGYDMQTANAEYGHQT